MRCNFVATEARNAKGWALYVCSNPGCQIKAWSPHPAERVVCKMCQAGAPVEPPPLTRDRPCIHLGGELRQEVCQGCVGKQRIKVFACAVHGESTIGKKVSVACCKHCQEYSPAKSFSVPLPPIAVRNLIYHVCPLTGNDGWRQNVRQLLARVSVFNGKRIVAIATGEGLEEPRLVRREFERVGGDWTFLELPNDRELREVATFLPLLLSVQSTASDEATFYAHTKGNSTADDPRGAELWRNMMYAKLLGGGDGEWPLCARELESHAFVGTHKIVWPAGAKPPYPTRLKHGHWMLAGTFFWFRHDLVFSRNDWRNIPADRYGAEAWPSGMFEPHEVASVFQLWPESQYPSPNPYNPALYRAHVERGEFGPDEPLPPLEPALARDGTELPAEAWEALTLPQRPRTSIAASSVLRPGVSGDKTVVVIGTFRGGTSFVAQLLTEIGVPMGTEFAPVVPSPDYVSYEDGELSEAINDVLSHQKLHRADANEWLYVQQTIADRDAAHPRLWGFKKPSSVFLIDQLLPLLRNPHLVVVVRDPLAIWQSGAAHGGGVTWQGARHHAGCTLDLLEKPRAPTLAISYERGKSQPGEVRTAMREFLGLSPGHAKIEGGQSCAS